MSVHMEFVSAEQVVLRNVGEIRGMNDGILASFPTIAELQNAYHAAADELSRNDSGYAVRRAQDLRQIATLLASSAGMDDIYRDAMMALTNHRINLGFEFTAWRLLGRTAENPDDTANYRMIDPRFLDRPGTSALGSIPMDREEDCKIAALVFSKLPPDSRQRLYFKPSP